LVQNLDGTPHFLEGKRERKQCVIEESVFDDAGVVLEVIVDGTSSSVAVSVSWRQGDEIISENNECS